MGTCVKRNVEKKARLDGLILCYKTLLCYSKSVWQLLREPEIHSQTSLFQIFDDLHFFTTISRFGIYEYEISTQQSNFVLKFLQ
jgi:hypothetical protein